MNYKETINKLTKKINENNKDNLSPIQKMLLANQDKRKRTERIIEAERTRKGESIALLAARGIKRRELQNANRNSDEDIER